MGGPLPRSRNRNNSDGAACSLSGRSRSRPPRQLRGLPPKGGGTTTVDGFLAWGEPGACLLGPRPPRHAGELCARLRLWCGFLPGEGCAARSRQPASSCHALLTSPSLASTVRPSKTEEERKRRAPRWLFGQNTQRPREDSLCVCEIFLLIALSSVSFIFL